jgi:hypothetical protein
MPSGPRGALLGFARSWPSERELGRFGLAAWAGARLRAWRAGGGARLVGRAGSARAGWVAVAVGSWAGERWAARGSAGGGLGGPRESWVAGRIRKDWFLLFSFFISFLFLYLLFFYILSTIPIEFLIKHMLHKITHSAK